VLFSFFESGDQGGDALLDRRNDVGIPALAVIA
jgi:hypothetical protein